MTGAFAAAAASEEFSVRVAGRNPKRRFIRLGGLPKRSHFRSLAPGTGRSDPRASDLYERTAIAGTE